MRTAPALLALAGTAACAALAQAPVPAPPEAPAAPVEVPDARLERRIVVDTRQVIADAARARATADAWREWADDFRASFGTMFGERFAAARPVKGAPYSADVSTEVTQKLADGNVISRTTSGRVYRDGEGRTRQETVVGGEAKSIELRDPVAGTAVMLLPGTRKAVRLPSFAFSGHRKSVQVVRLGDHELRVENGKASLDGKRLRGHAEITLDGKSVVVDGDKVTVDGKPLADGAYAPGVIVKSIEGPAGTKREEVRVHVVRGPEEFAWHGAHAPAPPVPPEPPMPPLLGPLGGRLDGSLLPPKGERSSLGTKTIEGVKAEGTAVTRTIPAGEIGNRDPIVVRHESWYSPELKVTVLTRQSDPRYGDTVYRLTHIRREEPAADLFKVPDDYEGSRRRPKG